MPKESPTSDFAFDPPPAQWPLRGYSRALHTAGVRWHYQQVGTGPILLLLHGSGGSTASWSRCMPTLAASHTVIAVDLPGHGFSIVDRATDAVGDVYSLTGMARAVRQLLDTLELEPTAAAGHSAGTAVLVRMALDGLYRGTRIAGFNPALVAPPALYVNLVAPLVAPVAESSLVARGAAWIARSTGVIPAMLASTGSTLTDATRARYEYLCTRASHCHAALSMMSRWDLPSLVRDAAKLAVPLDVYAGVNDRWVPYRDLAASVALLPTATMHRIEGAGHLIPEELPDVVIAALSVREPRTPTATD